MVDPFCFKIPRKWGLIANLLFETVGIDMLEENSETLDLIVIERRIVSIPAECCSLGQDLPRIWTLPLASSLAPACPFCASE